LKGKRNTMSEMVILDSKKRNVPGPSAYKTPDFFASLK
jgi:hypothetical protein